MKQEGVAQNRAGTTLDRRTADPDARTAATLNNGDKNLWLDLRVTSGTMTQIRELPNDCRLKSEYLRSGAQMERHWRNTEFNPRTTARLWSYEAANAYGAIDCLRSYDAGEDLRTAGANAGPDRIHSGHSACHR
ncbi:hypothetical protein HAX54_045598 [Datura stramonium]|uniref:Uncharacterized protein n=1 Tax=Datura stramonium TaxID=4076 RepID=A0ABS8SQV1_DATST|nr:hypothetical protein [Datura stramonium]